jgi:hypothetical protein
VKQDLYNENLLNSPEHFCKKFAAVFFLIPFLVACNKGLPPTSTDGITVQSNDNTIELSEEIVTNADLKVGVKESLIARSCY